MQIHGKKSQIKEQERIQIRTLIRAIGSWPACRNCAISFRISLSCPSLLFCSNLIREIANVKQVLLQKESQKLLWTNSSMASIETKVKGTYLDYTRQHILTSQKKLKLKLKT